MQNDVIRMSHDQKMTVKLAEKLKIAIRMLFLDSYYSSSCKNFNICNTKWIEKGVFYILHNILRWILSTALSTFHFEEYSLSVHVRLVISRPQLSPQLAGWEKKWTSFITFMYS